MSMPIPRTLPDLASVSPAVEIHDVMNPVLANARKEFIDQDILPLQAKALQARQVVVRLGNSVVLYYATNQRVRTRPKLLPGFVGYLTFGPTASGSVDGIQIGPDVMLAVPSDRHIGVVAQAGYESITFLVRPEDVRRHVDIRGAEADYPLPQQVDLLRVDPQAAGRLFSWGQRLMEIAVAQPEVFNNNQEQRMAAQSDLLDTLLSTLTLASKRAPQRKERTLQMQSDIVRQAEVYALAHVEERPYVIDLCRATGVSERTLEYAFRAIMGLSPKGYLIKLRLNKVHQALLTAAPHETSVTKEALSWGFWHFGEFSKAYKAFFDELPSDTLRRTN